MKKLKHLLVITWLLVATAVSACYVYSGPNAGVLWGVSPTATSSNYHIDYLQFLNFYRSGMTWDEAISATFNINTGTGIKNNMTVTLPCTIYVSIKPFVEGMPITEVRLQYKSPYNFSWRDVAVIHNPPSNLNITTPQALFGKNCIKPMVVTDNSYYYFRAGDRIGLRLYITDGINESGNLNEDTMSDDLADTIYFDPATVGTYNSVAGAYGGFLIDSNGDILISSWRSVYVAQLYVDNKYRIGR